MTFDVVYDIGACMGNFSRNLRSVLPSSQYYLFEANVAYLPSLIEPGFNSFIATLSNEGREEVDFWVGLNTGDSYYKETTTIYDDKDMLKMSCTTLDKMISEKNLPIPNFLKIDTQGSELDILSAAKQLMGKTEMILCECPIIEYNKGAPKMSDYLEFFKSHDYVPVELTQIHRAEDTLIQIDVLYMLRSAKQQFLSENKVIRI
jgi:FkbM family methyltransferase